MRLPLPDLDVEVRLGAVEDVSLLLDFIRAMAEFERLEVVATETSLREALFGDRPAARTLLAFVNGEPVAYAVYFFTFATMVGRRGLWLDDLYVAPEYRRRGIAGALMAHLASIAVTNNCARFEWMVLGWNTSAIGFYEGLGARVLPEWRICRLDGRRLRALGEGT